MQRVFALVDARNVLRSKWPNIPEDELVELVRAWARDEDVHAYVIFDGRAPGDLVGEQELDEHAVLVGTGEESADDWIARKAPELEPVWLITSDRGLRARVDAERTTGGGSFARELTGEK
jgi:hypothetical protein